MALVQVQHIFHPSSITDETPPAAPASPRPLPSSEEQKEEETEAYISVRLPELFILFLSGTPDVNPYYDEIKPESERWLATQCHFDEQATKRLATTDFSYFCSVSVPKAGREELRTVCDWGNWVFPFDDMFDNGKLRDDPTRAQEVVDNLLAGMGIGIGIESSIGSSKRADDPLIEVHNSVWRRIVQVCLHLHIHITSTSRAILIKTPPDNIPRSVPFQYLHTPTLTYYPTLTRATSQGTQHRFATAMHDYCLGSIEQVRNASSNTHPSIDGMLDLRRQSAGVAPLFALVEYAHKLNIPEHVFECTSIKEIQRIGVDFVLIQNDILSYCKEEVRIQPPSPHPLDTPR
ncbi:isoprenoid synthase domain-containing protein [Aspergillus cavernicola]|uniref:Terpene synthase n=1 Tax=Aspergillus cavernicola TaxID=176166 RepID=A0ABR4IBL0_9EURO